MRNPFAPLGPVVCLSVLPFWPPASTAPDPSPGQATMIPADLDPARLQQDPENRCVLSRVCVNREGVMRAPSSAGLLLDDNANTGLTIERSGLEACELRFVGAPRWFDRVEVTTDAGAIEVETLDHQGTWHPFLGEVTTDGDPSATHRLIIMGPDTEALGLRMRSVPESAGAAGGVSTTVSFFEIGAFFDGRDPDKMGMSPAADGYNYHADWVNDYPGADNDLSKCDNDAKGLRDALPGSWDKWLHGNDNAWEEHFKRADLGGTNGSHVDDADLSYFAGHGSSGTDTDGDDVRVLLFGDDDNDDDELAPGEAAGAWDGDLEWMCFANCQTMADADRWYGAMYGTHLVLGWLTNMKDVAMGEDFGDYMVDNGIFDSAERIKTSWFDAGEDHHGDGYTAYVIGETSAMGRDYLHGEGTVQDDPTHNGFYYWWSYSTSSGIFEGAIDFGSESGLTGSPSDPIVFPATSEGGIPVTIDRTLLSPAAMTSLPIYNVVPVVVDTGYVRILAGRICSSGGPFCSGPIGPGNPGDLNLINGAYELRVCTNTGAMHYHDASRWMEWLTTRPMLPSESAVVQQADNLLNSIGRRHADAVVDRVDYPWQGARFVPATGMAFDLPESTFATAARVVYKRMLGTGLPVAGPGGSMTVAFGGGGIVQRVFEGGWRKVTPGPSVNLIPVTQAIGFLNAHGSDATVDGIMPFVYGIQVDAWQLGYYEYSCDVPQTTIRPVYIFDCTITESAPGVTPPVTSHDRVHVWAEALPPDATILMPPDSTCVAQGATVCFQGSASGGVSPLTFEWRDDIGDALVGTGPSACNTLPPVPAGHSEGDDMHTVELTVRDALGREGRASVRVCLLPATSVPGGTAARSTAPFFEAVLPNPTLGYVRMRLNAPAAGNYRVEVFDVSGRRVRVLTPEIGEAGGYSLEWDGCDDGGRQVSPGVYFARAEGKGVSATKQIVVVR